MLNNTIRAIVEYVTVTCDHSAPPMSPMNTQHAHCKPTVPLLAAHHRSYAANVHPDLTQLS